ncbi:MAG TPA: hypothetical protein VNO35_15740 [Steroidobacteraceae bacterium]|nr:hypothetical protein [Steroidobacteraceae bacterium]
MDAITATSAIGLHERHASLYRYYVLGILTAVGILSWMDRQLFSILLQSIKHDLHLSDTELGLLGDIAFGLFYAAVGLPVAKLADRTKRRARMRVGFWRSRQRARIAVDGERLLRELCARFWGEQYRFSVSGRGLLQSY